MFHFRPEYDGIHGVKNRAGVALFYLFAMITFGFYVFQTGVLIEGLPGVVDDWFGASLNPFLNVVVSVFLGFFPGLGNFVAAYVGTEVLSMPYGVSFALFMFVGLGLFPLTYKMHSAYARHLMAYKKDPIYRNAYDRHYGSGSTTTRKERMVAEEASRERQAKAKRTVDQAAAYNRGETSDPGNAAVAKMMADLERDLGLR